MGERQRVAFEAFANTMSLLHGQIAAINDRLDKQGAPQAPPVASHRGFGSLPLVSPPSMIAQDAVGDAIASMDENPSEWAAGLLKVMREERNCGMASDVYATVVD